jgi:4-hydroxymandelate oxidase
LGAKADPGHQAARHRPVSPCSRRIRGVRVWAMAEPIDVLEYERLASASMSEMAWEYFRGGAGDELTVRWNHEAYQRIRLLPRALVDVSQLDTRVRLLGRDLPHPILLAPVAYQRLLNPRGELATKEGANASGATMVLSTFSTTSLEDVASVGGRAPWFQFYIGPDRDVTLGFLRRVEAAGYETVVLTVDTPVLGARYREWRSNFALPPGMEKANFKGMPVGLGSHRPNENDIYSDVLDPKLTWKDVDWLRSQTRLPVILKGILNPDDAARAADSGVAGVIVSNHGGRVLDTVPSTIDVLPAIVARVDGRLPVLIDGGVRRGTDILKAIALGATAVLVGRPYAFGLAVGGADGVARIVNILRREFEMAMALTGRPSIAAIDASVILR